MSFFAVDGVNGGARLFWTPTRAALISWAVIAAILLWSGWPAITAMQTSNPDDALRLVQVRDLLGGQAWWDVSQNRINPAGGGGLMHWSRLIDLPIAAGIAALTPMVGSEWAERIIACAWPLLLLAALFMLLARSMLLLGDRRIAYVAPMLAATSYVTLYQFTPLRIDHHNVQILLSLALLYLTLRPANAMRGAIAGLLAAMHLAISIEGLPSVALFAAILAVDWALDRQRGPETRARLTAFLVSLALSAAVLQFATRGPDALMQTWCDALSLPYLGALAVAAMTVPIGARMLPEGAHARWWRIGLLAVAGALAGAALLLIEPGCAAGPFATLDPLVKAHWYDHVREGLAVWQPLDMVSGFAIAPTLIGLIGSGIAWRRSGDAAVRHAWLIIIATLLGTGLLSLLVLRTASTAQLIALPGCAYLGIALWTWARSIAATLPRVLASLCAIIALPPVSGTLLGLAITAIVPPSATMTSDTATGGAATGGANDLTCVDPLSVAALNRLAPATILAPLDIGPDLLQRTRHSVVATGHHRNNVAMALTIRAFTGPADAAQALVRQGDATLIIACLDAPEFRNFEAVAGDSLADRLAHGPTPDWLVPVPLGEGAMLRAWRMRD